MIFIWVTANEQIVSSLQPAFWPDPEVASLLLHIIIQLQFPVHRF